MRASSTITSSRKLLLLALRSLEGPGHRGVTHGPSAKCSFRNAQWSTAAAKQYSAPQTKLTPYVNPQQLDVCSVQTGTGGQQVDGVHRNHITAFINNKLHCSTCW
jgi:hypothetical protein